MKKRLEDGQVVAIRYRMRFCAIWQWVAITKLERSIFFGVGFEQRHLFGIASIAGTENPRLYTQSKGS